jgi:hypothetical protein
MTTVHHITQVSALDILIDMTILTINDNCQCKHNLILLFVQVTYEGEFLRRIPRIPMKLEGTYFFKLELMNYCSVKINLSSLFCCKPVSQNKLKTKSVGEVNRSNFSSNS